MVAGMGTQTAASQANETEQIQSLIIGVTSRKSDPEWLERWTGNYVKRLHEYGAAPTMSA